MRNVWWAITVAMLGGCSGGGGSNPAAGPTDGALDDASLEAATPGSGEDSMSPPAPEDGGMATVLDSAAVEWSEDAGYVNPGAG